MLLRPTQLFLTPETRSVEAGVEEVFEQVSSLPAQTQGFGPDRPGRKIVENHENVEKSPKNRSDTNCAPNGFLDVFCHILICLSY